MQPPTISILQLIVVSTFIPRGTSVAKLAYLLLALQVTGTIMAGTLCALYISDFWRGWHFSINGTISLFIACFPFAVIAILGIIYQKLSFTILSFLGNASMVGWFSAAARAVDAARIGHIVAFTVLYPAMSELNTDEDSAKTFRFSWLLLTLAASGGAVLLFLFAKPLIDIFFGADYLPSIPVLKILSFTLIPYTVNSFLSLVFITTRKEKVVVRVLLVSLLILVFSNLWLIPLAGQVGASWAILITETIQSGLFIFEWKMRFSLKAKNLLFQRGVSHEISDLS